MASTAVSERVWRPVDLAVPIRSAPLLAEDVFQHVLVLERKRSERSGNPFLLVCLDVSSLRGETRQLDLVLRDALISTLRPCLRETDLIGWHREEEVIGILLTELGDSSAETIRRVVTKKIQDSLGRALPSPLLEQIRVSAHFFPEESRYELSGEFQKAVYPDLTHLSAERNQHIAKRVLDVVLSLAGILLLSPLLVIIAILVKVTSRGPVLFRQERLGQCGRPFQFLKFRSMRVDADSSIHEKYIEEFIKKNKTTTDREGCPVYKLVADPRVTRLGRFLRKTSLDELPQFFNVLKGDMSLVGPRPPIPYEIKQYDIWHRRRVLEMRPGITGIWQVHGRSRTTFDEMVRMDLQYARNWSIWTDIRLILETPMAVLRGEGAC